MQHADARFERVQPIGWRNLPFSDDDLDAVPSLWEALGWIALGANFLILCVLFLGVA